MKKVVNLTESQLRDVVKQVIKESFEDDGLADMVKSHGGLAKNLAFHDARRYGMNHDIRYMKPVAYISEEEYEVLNKLNWFNPINEQLLICNDGGAIVVEKGDEPMGNGYRSEYQDKMYSRTKNYKQDIGQENGTFGWVPNDWYYNVQRRDKHEFGRGKRSK